MNNGTTALPPCEQIFLNKKMLEMCIVWVHEKSRSWIFLVDVYILQIDTPLVLLDCFVNCFVVQLFASGFLSASPMGPCFSPMHKASNGDGDGVKEVSTHYIVCHNP
jgi:hypothetical protein